MTLRLATAAPAPPPPSAEAFDAARLRQDAAPASPLLRRLLYTLCALVAAVAVWVHAGRLDIVAVADGRLVPRTRLKIVQPADGGVVREILAVEGAQVIGGEVLVRLDPGLAQAELRALTGELAQRTLQLRRIDAEIDETPIARHPATTTRRLHEPTPSGAPTEARGTTRRAGGGGALARRAGSRGGDDAVRQARAHGADSPDGGGALRAARRRGLRQRALRARATARAHRARARSRRPAARGRRADGAARTGGAATRPGDVGVSPAAARGTRRRGVCNAHGSPRNSRSSTSGPKQSSCGRRRPASSRIWRRIPSGPSSPPARCS